jgi:transcription elongation factor Elf1
MTTKYKALKLAREVIQMIGAPSPLHFSKDEIIKWQECNASIDEALAQQEGQSNYCLQCESLSRELAALKAQQSNEQSKCNHTKTITRADIDGNQIETTCGECGERVAQQSNEQVEPVARAWSEGYLQGVEDERTSETNIGIAGFGAKVEPARENPYTHPPVPTAQPKEQERWIVGDSAFECWYQAHPKACGGDKQLAREAYEAGMNDPLTQPKKPEQEPVAWINWCAATGKRSVSFECESELASQPLYLGVTQITQDRYSNEIEPAAWANTDDNSLHYHTRMVYNSAQFLDGHLVPLYTRPPRHKPPTDEQLNKAAMKLADCMDYPWDYITKEGQQRFKDHAKAIIEAAHGIKGEA